MTYGNHHPRHHHPHRFGSPCGPGRAMGRDRSEDEMNEEGGRGGWGRGGMRRGGPPWMRGRGRMFGQGDLRLLLLALIVRKPSHGYDLIRTIEARFGGAYAPSPGTIYPTLTLLEEQELIAGASEPGGKKSFTATDQGRAHLGESGRGGGRPHAPHRHPRRRNRGPARAPGRRPSRPTPPPRHHGEIRRLDRGGGGPRARRARSGCKGDRGGRTMTDANPAPSLTEWAGGHEALTRLFERFYERVAAHGTLAPIFAEMNRHHPVRVADFVAEVLGGEKNYTRAGGSHAGMIGHHLRRHLTENQRRAWVALLLDTADEVGLPADPEFRASFVGYLEWGSRLAVMNSQDGVEPMDERAPMPRWTWSSPGGPYRG